MGLFNIRYKMQSGAITVACGSCACAGDYSCVRQKHAEQCPVCETMRTLVFSIRPHMLESAELSHVLPLNLARYKMELKSETTLSGSQELLLNLVSSKDHLRSRLKGCAPAADPQEWLHSFGVAAVFFCWGLMRLELRSETRSQT